MMAQWEKDALKYWRKHLARAEQWLRAPAKNKPKSERSIRKWTIRRDLAAAEVARLVTKALNQ